MNHGMVAIHARPTDMLSPTFIICATMASGRTLAHIVNVTIAPASIPPESANELCRLAQIFTPRVSCGGIPSKEAGYRALPLSPALSDTVVATRRYCGTGHDHLAIHGEILRHTRTRTFCIRSPGILKGHFAGYGNTPPWSLAVDCNLYLKKYAHSFMLW